MLLESNWYHFGHSGAENYAKPWLFMNSNTRIFPDDMIFRFIWNQEHKPIWLSEFAILV